MKTTTVTIIQATARLACAAIMAALFVPAEPVRADITSGLISHYDFLGNADDLAGSNNATVYSSVLAADRFGSANGAYTLNGLPTLSGGGSYIMPAQNFNLVGLNTNITMSAWIMTSDPEGYIFHQANGGQMALRVTEGKASFFTHNSDGNWYAATDTNLLPTNTWVNITGVYHASTKNELWVNGQLVATTPVPPSTLFDVTWSDYFYAGLGAYRESWFPDSLQSPLAFTVDEFRVYARALEAPDIAELAVPEPSTTVLVLGALGLALSARVCAAARARRFRLS